ncbi:MAG: hypothetical protein K2X87_21670, partial [Gemmataceae bacterium]|nr:hypothetical protein [Gemmataceae bacterium]
MDELLRMAGCGLRVATVALPVGLAAWLTARRLRTPVFPRPTPDQARWNGFEVLAAFVLVQLVTPALVLALIAPVTRFIPLDQSPPATTLRTLWVGVLAFPAQLGLLYMVAEVAGRGRRPAAGARVAPARVAAGVLGWAALTPAVLGLHVGLGWLFREMGWATGEHPLARFGAGTDLQRALLVAQAGVTAPVVEELLFRGVLLGWLVGGRPLVRPAPGRRPAAD